jgi:TRAP transporter 4TM/12TM fusion protein
LGYNIINLVLVSATIASGIYIFIKSPEIMSGTAGRYYPLGIAFGILTILLLLEGNRRQIGWIIPIIVMIGLIYGRFGEYFPMVIAHVNFDLQRMTTLLYLGTDGIYGMIARVSFSYISLFIIYAQFLRNTGAGDFLLDFSYAIFGRIRGGPAKVAVVASCLFGSISGSAVANVAGTGSVTIPLMKKTGYSPEYAGAIEAAASTGGQFMPPIMGASAFLIADFLGVPYVRVAMAALIPALLYYFALFLIIHLQALKENHIGLTKDELPDLKIILRKGYHHFVSPIVLIYLLGVEQWTPTRAAFWSILAMLGVAVIKREKSFFSEIVLKSLTSSIRGVVMMGIISGALGIIVGIMGLTGLSLKLSTVLVDVSGGNLPLLLFLTMVASIILGMGLPTIAAYVLLAIIVAPALEDSGIPLMAAHLFVLYFGTLSVLTPPVCLASYTASTISGADPMATGFLGFRLSLVGFLLPFVFVYNPSFLLIDPSWSMVFPLLTFTLAVLALATALQGYFLEELVFFQRALLLIAAIALIANNYWFDLLGIVLLAVVYTPQISASLKSKKMHMA